MVASPKKAAAAAAASAGGSVAQQQTAPRGAFILFEGIDRCGKSTQAERLVSNLRNAGVDAELWRFPDRETTIGRMINDYLSSKSELEDHVIHLLFSANRWEKSRAMEAKLAAGTSLVVDRYSYSGVAFSAAKGLDRGWCEAQEVGLPAPDAVLYLRLAVEDAAARGGFGEERYEKEEMQREVLSYFEAWARGSGGLWRPVSALQTREELEGQLLGMALECVRRCGEGGAPLGRLWGVQQGEQQGQREGQCEEEEGKGAGHVVGEEGQGPRAALAGIDGNVPPPALPAGGGKAAAAGLEGPNAEQGT